MHTITLTRRTIAAAIIALVVTPAVVAGTTAWATTRSFSDVPSSHPFHDEINWADVYGIVNGYPDGTFRPSGTVTRQAAVAFLSRYNDSLTLRTSELNPSADDAFFQVISCPPGQRALAGGGNLNLVNTFMTSSAPVPPEGWGVSWETEGDAVLDPSVLELWALCAPGPAGGVG